jgi:hypothetical protein
MNPAVTETQMEGLIGMVVDQGSEEESKEALTG